MNQVIKEKWIDALLNGGYEQGTNCLRSADNKFCCLGVLTDLAAKEGIVSWEDQLMTHKGVEVYHVEHEFAVLPEDVQVWAGLGSDCPSFRLDGCSMPNLLTEVNDEGMPFLEIANIIREQF